MVHIEARVLLENILLLLRLDKSTFQEHMQNADLLNILTYLIPQSMYFQKIVLTVSPPSSQRLYVTTVESVESVESPYLPSF